MITVEVTERDQDRRVSFCEIDGVLRGLCC